MQVPFSFIHDSISILMFLHLPVVDFVHPLSLLYNLKGFLLYRIFRYFVFKVYSSFPCLLISLLMSTIGCDKFSYWRRISDGLLDEKFGRQRYHSEWRTLVIFIFFIGHLKQSSYIYIFFFRSLKIRPRYSFKKKEIRPGNLQVCYIFIVICKHLLVMSCFSLMIFPLSFWSLECRVVNLVMVYSTVALGFIFVVKLKL